MTMNTEDICNISKLVKKQRNVKGDIVKLLSVVDQEKDVLTRSLIYQWAEMARVWQSPLEEGGTQTKVILREIDNYLEGCSYFVGYTRSAADVFMYHLLYDILNNLTPNERRDFPSICRWFNHIQQDSSLRQDNPLINFASTFITPATSPAY